MSAHPHLLKIFMVLAILLCPATILAQDSAGSAFGESVDLSIKSAFSLVTVEAQSGPIPQVSGGTPPPFTLSDSLLSVDVNANVKLISNILPATAVGILETGLLEVETSGNTSPQSDSSASVADVDLELLGAVLLPLVVGIQADAVVSTASATGSCDSGLSASGTTSLVNAFLASDLAELVGIEGALLANPPPNFVLLDIDLLGGHLRIVLNEQISSGNGTTSAGITVNAIHITLEQIPLAALITDVTGDVIISQSKASVTCAVADLSITKTDSTDPVTVGQPMFYTLTIHNDGPDTASNVVVVDNWPSAFASLDSVDPSQGSCGLAGSVITCDLGDISSGGEATVTVNGTPTAVGQMVNSASVSSDAADPNPNDDEDTEDTVVDPPLGVSADLEITISDSPDPVTAGQTLTVTLDVTNNGPDNATNTVVVYDIPAGQEIDSVTPSQGNCNVTATQVICNLGTVNDGGTADVVIEMTPLLPGVLIHHAVVSSNVTDPNPEDNEASEDGLVVVVDVEAEADISIVKTDSIDPVVVGQPLTYTLAVHNGGPDDTNTVFVSDNLPAGLAFVSAEATQGSCSHLAGLVSCNLGAMANNTDASITLIVSPTESGGFINSATVVADVFDPDEEDNTDSEESTVTPGAADLAITKVSAPNPAIVGENLVYTLNISNAGPDNAALVQVIDVLPASVNFVSALPSQGNCGEVAGTVTCNLGTVNSGNGASITINVTPTAAGELSNTAIVDSLLDDPNEEDNTDTDVNTARIREADLAITKTSSVDPAIVGVPYVYTLTITNSGPDDAINVEVVDTLPASVQFESATPSQGNCLEAAGTVTCELGNIAPQSGETVLIEVTPQEPGNASNTATVDSETEDPDTSDNTATHIQEIINTGRATFRVTKFFTDGNDVDEVTVSIDCNTGLILDQDKDLGDEEWVEFVVTSYTVGTLNCSITEDGETGYAGEYNNISLDVINDESCAYTEIGGEAAFECEITNSPLPVDVKVTKEWVFESSGASDIYTGYTLTLYCDAEIEGGYQFGMGGVESPAGENGFGCGLIKKVESSQGNGGYHDWCRSYSRDGAVMVTAQVIPEFPDSNCYWQESGQDSAVEVDQSNCASLTISAGSGAACTITNTVFFEGIPVLDQRGLVLLALLVLSMGLIGVRRIAS